MYTLRKGVTKNVRTKLASISGTAVLLFTSLSGAAPLFFTQKAFAASPADEYVATTGTDSADCSDSGAPCKTITYALTQADNGTVINVSAGTYTGNNINVDKSVTIDGASGAVVQVPNGDDGFDINADNVTIQGLTITGPADGTSSYQSYAWGSTNTRGIAVMPQAQNYTFSITGNTIRGVRNGILVNSYSNTNALITGNTIDNTKSAISFDYSDGAGVDVSGNQQSVFGNDWGMNLHLNGYWNGSSLQNGVHILGGSAPAGAQTNVLDLSNANNGWTVYDQAYATANRSAVEVATTGSSTAQGDPLGPIGPTTSGIQTGVNDVVAGGTVNVQNGSYNGGVNIDKSGVKLVGQSQAGVTVTASSATPYGQGVSVVGQDGVSISNMTFSDPAGSPISYAFQGYQDTDLSLSNLSFNGPGKTSTSHIGGVDVNSSQGVTYNNVSVSNYYKNGFSFTAQFTSPDDYSRNISLNNITSNNNGWAGIAFYAMNSSSTVGHDITGVTFGGNNTVTNNGQGLFIEGDSDANHISHATPSYDISGTGGAPVDIGGTAFSGNTQDIDNYQTNDLEALSATFGGQTGADMSYSQRAALKSSHDIIDSATYPAFGTVNIFDAGSYVNNPSLSKFMVNPEYVRSNNSSDTAAQVLAPKDAQSVRFTYTQTDGSNVYSNVVGTQHIQAGQYPVPATGQQQWRGGVSAAAGTYTVTAEYQVGSEWFPVTGQATAYVLGNPTGSFVIPSAGNSYFRPTDNPLRITAGDKNDQFRDVVFRVDGTNYQVDRASCDLREAGSYVLCDINGASNWTGLSEGTYTATATLYNQAGNHAQITSQSFTIDGTRPVLSNFKITHTQSAYGSSVAVSADATDSSGIKNVTFYVTAPRVGDGICDGNGTQLNSTTGSLNSGSTYAGTLDTSGLNGDYCLNAVAEDNAANHSLPVATVKATFDDIAPDAPTLVSPDDGAVVNGSSITQSWSDGSSDIDHYIYQSFNDAGATSLRYQTTYTSTSKTAANVAETTYWWRVAAVDKAGNQSGWSTLRKITVDNTSPVVDITAPTSGILKGTVTISGTVTDANPDHYYLVVKDSGNNVVAGPGTVTAANVSDYSWDTTGVPDGTYTIDLEARDKAGNKDASSAQTKTVTVDNTAPDTPQASPAGGSYTSTQLVSLSSNDTGSGIAGIYYTTDGSAPSDTNGTLYNGAFSVSSSETVKAVAYDNAGNESTTPMTETYTITPIIPHTFFFSSSVHTTTGGTGTTNPQTTTNTGNGGTGGTGAGAGGGGAGTGGGTVLGASTNTPNTSSSDSSKGNGDSKGTVLGTTAHKSNVSNFLGLGWWWLPILVIAFGLLYGFTRRANTTDKRGS